MAQILYQNIETGDAHDITTLVKSASWKTKRTGSPAQLSLTLVADPAVEITEGGIVTLTKTAAIQMKEYGVRCNAVAPTIVDTPGQRVYNTSVGQDGIQMGDARHVALAVRYLLCDAPPVMTGQVLDLFTTL